MLGGMKAVLRAVVAATMLATASTTLAQTRPALELGPPAPAELIGREGASEVATRSAAGDGVDPHDPPRVEAGLTEFLSTRFHAHEPIYFLAGPLNPNSKFQVSLKYQLFSDTGDIARAAPWAADLFVAYSQTSFWDIGGDSSPFFDSSYRPEFLYQLGPRDVRDVGWLPGVTRFDLQAGLRHESNGRDGPESRSLNIAYVSPIFTFGDDGVDNVRRDANDADGGSDFFVAVAPRLWMYLTDNSDNPDIYQYRGYGDLRLVAGWRGGFQAALTARLGNDFDKGALQVDLTYPLQKLAIRDLGMYLHGQFFTGYGESLIEYDESTTSFRLGLSLVR
jgi:outer membrane phospholipase A